MSAKPRNLRSEIRTKSRVARSSHSFSKVSTLRYRSPFDEKGGSLRTALFCQRYSPVALSNAEVIELSIVGTVSASDGEARLAVGFCLLRIGSPRRNAVALMRPAFLDLLIRGRVTFGSNAFPTKHTRQSLRGPLESDHLSALFR